jgi:hypothetical protein
MVLLKTLFAGAAMLIIGILLLTVLGQYVTVTVQNTERQNVDPQVAFMVGDVTDRSYSLPSGVSAFGSVGVTQAPTNQTSDVRFTIFDAQNYQLWSSGAQANSIYSTTGQGQFNYTFTTQKSGIYHFVFDNRASVFKKYVVFSLAYDEIVTGQESDARIPLLAWGLAAAGGLLAVVGMIRKPSISWA